MVGEDFAEFGESLRVVEHGELAVRVAGIIAGAEFDGVDVEGFEFVEDSGQGKLGEQRGEDSDLHA
jgi:hypothetical protein